MIDFWLLIIFFVMGIALHEIGHYLVARGLGGKPIIGIDFKGVYVAHLLEGEDRVNVIRGGVIAGYIPGVFLLMISYNMGLIYILVYTLSVFKELYVSLTGVER